MSGSPASKIFKGTALFRECLPLAQLLLLVYFGGGCIREFDRIPSYESAVGEEGEV